MKIKRLNEMNEAIEWRGVEKQYYDYVERTNNEMDYDTYFKYMKNLVNDPDLPWGVITKRYYNYVDETNGELDFDQYFDEFKKIVIENS